MILVDAGPLIALINADERHHAACRQALSQLTAPLMSTWAAFTEAMHLLANAGGWKAQDFLWQFLERDDLQLLELDRPMAARARNLMRKYRDVPMDLADASLVAAAEALNSPRIFTLDKDFHVYRFKGRKRFEIIP